MRRGFHRRALAGGALIVLLASPSDALDVYVDGSAGSDLNDGLSWGSAKATVGAALAAADGQPGPHTVSVAAGVYYESITVPPDLALVGGFPSGGGPRDPEANAAVLDGGGTRPVVLFGPGTDGSSLDGFLIQRGMSDATDRAGGITITGSAATVSNCRVERNRGCAGGGMFIDARGLIEVPRVSRTLVRGNVATICPGNFAMEGGGILLGSDSDAPTSQPILSDCLLEGNDAEGPGSRSYAAGLAVGGAVRLEHVRVRRNLGDGAYFVRGNPATCLDCEFTDNEAWGVRVHCIPPHVVVFENCTFSGNGNGSILGDGRTPAGGPWVLDVAVRRSVFWGDRGAVLDPGTNCYLDNPVVEDSVIEGGFPGGSNILDVDPLFAPGPAGDYYLGQIAAGQPQDSPALDQGPILASAVGLDSRVTRTDSVPDTGLVDWGVHYEPYTGLRIVRGTRPAALLLRATVTDLPWTDDPGVLHAPALPLLFYRVVPSENPIRVLKDIAQDTVRLEF